MFQAIYTNSILNRAVNTTVRVSQELVALEIKIETTSTADDHQANLDGVYHSFDILIHICSSILYIHGNHIGEQIWIVGNFLCILVMVDIFTSIIWIRKRCIRYNTCIIWLYVDNAKISYLLVHPLWIR